MGVLLDRSTFTARGADAVTYLQSMVSNDVEAIPAGGGVFALLLTPKARVIADLEVFSTGEELVLACDPSRLDDTLRVLRGSRFRRKVELEPSSHAVVWGDGAGAVAELPTPIGPYALLAGPPPEQGDRAAWEIARVEAGMPRFGREFDTESMPAEAGLDALAVSFSKGCYPGQEPVARLHYRGRANRGLRGLQFAAKAPAAPGADVVADGRQVGRVTSPVASPRLGPIALAVLRREVEEGDEVEAGGVAARVCRVPFGASMP